MSTEWLALKGSRLRRDLLFLLGITASSLQAQGRRVSVVDLAGQEPGLTITGPGQGFGVIVQALGNSSGVIVADGSQQAIFFFDRAGRLVRTVGREGAGPGEFRSLRWLGWCPDGTLVAFDALLSRLSFLDSQGVWGRQTGAPMWLGVNNPISCGVEGQLTSLIARPTALQPKGQVTRVPAVIVQGREIPDTLLTLEGTAYYFAGRTPGYIDQPLGATAVVSTSGDWLVAGDTDRNIVYRIHLPSGRLDSIQLDLPKIRVSAEAWEEAKSSRLAAEPLTRTRELLRAVLSETPRPELAAGFTALLAGPDGSLWVRPTGRGTVTAWRWYNLLGIQRGILRLPSNVFPTEIGKEYLLGIERREDGSEAVVWYRIPAGVF